MIYFSFPDAQTLRDFVAATPKQVDQALYRSVKIALRKGKKLATDEIKKEVALPVRYIAGKLRVYGPKRDDLSGKITANPYGILLSKFRYTALKSRRKAQSTGKPDRRGRGIRVRVTPGQPKLMKNAFLVPLRNGGMGGIPQYGIATRLPGKKNRFKVHHAPSVYQVLGTLQEQVQEKASTELREVLSGELRYIVRGRRR